MKLVSSAKICVGPAFASLWRGRRRACRAVASSVGGWAVLLGLGLIGPSRVHAETSLSATEVIQNAVARAQQADTQARPGYTYTKLTLTEEIDAQGKVKERKQRVYQVLFQGGSTCLKLVTVNGGRPDEAEVKKQYDNQMNARHWFGQSKSGKGDSRENFLTTELVARYNFKLVGQELVNGRLAYQIAFEPRSPEGPEHRVLDRFFNRLSGTVWIDVQEFEIARAEVRLSSEVNLLWGAVGSLKKLAYTLTRTRVADGLWFNTFSSGDFQGRKLTDSLRIKTSSHSSNFRSLGLPS